MFRFKSKENPEEKRGMEETTQKIQQHRLDMIKRNTDRIITLINTLDETSIKMERDYYDCITLTIDNIIVTYDLVCMNGMPLRNLDAPVVFNHVYALYYKETRGVLDRIGYEG